MKKSYHGTTNGYNNYRCRCDLCKNAKSQDRLARLPEPGAQPKNKFNVCYASARITLDPEPLIHLISQKMELDSNMRARFRDWRANGIDIYRADYWCIRFDTHPYLVFGDKFYEGCPL